MSLFRRPKVEERSGTASPERLLMELTSNRIGGTSPASVSESSALTHSAVWAGAFLYSDLISSLPFSAFRDVDDAPVKLRSQPQLLVSPAVSVSPMSWRAQVVVSLILRGNAWGLILTRDQFGLDRKSVV